MKRELKRDEMKEVVGGQIGIRPPFEFLLRPISPDPGLVTTQAYGIDDGNEPIRDPNGPIHTTGSSDDPNLIEPVKPPTYGRPPVSVGDGDELVTTW